MSAQCSPDSDSKDIRDAFKKFAESKNENDRFLWRDIHTIRQGKVTIVLSAFSLISACVFVLLRTNLLRFYRDLGLRVSKKNFMVSISVALIIIIIGVVLAYFLGIPHNLDLFDRYKEGNCVDMVVETEEREQIRKKTMKELLIYLLAPFSGV